MSFWRNNEENPYQIQIEFKKSKIFKIEVHYSVEHCGVRKIFESLHI